MKQIICLFFALTIIQSHAAASSSSASSSSDKGKGKLRRRKPHIAIDMSALETTTQSQPVGTREYAVALTRAMYGKPCADKFCTDAFQKQLKHLKNHERETFHSLTTQLDRSNEVMTSRTRSKTRFDPGMLTEFTSPEMVQQALKALKQQHQENTTTIEEQNGTITSQAGSLLKTRRGLYATIITSILGVLGTIVASWIATTQSC